jgi:hypothetical protein
MVDYKNIDLGDIVIETYHGKPFHYFVIVEEYDEGLYRVIDIQQDREEVVDLKFDSQQLGRSYEIIKPNK